MFAVLLAQVFICPEQTDYLTAHEPQASKQKKKQNVCVFEFRLIYQDSGSRRSSAAAVRLINRSEDESTKSGQCQAPDQSTFVTLGVRSSSGSGSLSPCKPLYITIILF